MPRTVVLLLLIIGTSLASVAPASASELITWGVHDPALIVNKYGVARISYTDRNGVRHHVLAWDAMNARTPSQEQSQVKFKLDYSGGSGGFTAGYWKRMRNACKPYTGPALSDKVLACDAPNGSYWAVQSWRRELRDGGWGGSRRQQSAELHLSHWTGKLPQLFGDVAWLQNGKIDRVFGYLHYASQGVYGYSSTGVGAPLDGYGRNVYLDTRNPAWGKGWFRFNSALTHRSAGNFCLGMYKMYKRTHFANGSEYRLTVMGPGVTPIVSWHHKAPGAYSAAIEKQKMQELKSFTPSGDSCLSS